MSADFRGKGASPTNHCWCQKTRVIAVLCGIKIFAVRCFVLSQYMHLTDGRTDGQTDGQTELRQQYRALHYMQSHGKNGIKAAVTYRHVPSEMSRCESPAAAEVGASHGIRQIIAEEASNSSVRCKQTTLSSLYCCCDQFLQYLPHRSIVYHLCLLQLYCILQAIVS